MKSTTKAASRKPLDKGRPDYYITPTHNFTQYTRDCEEKYWSKDTAFDWSQNVRENLRQHLDQLDEEAFRKVVFMVLPMIRDRVLHHIDQIRRQQLPSEEDALKDIGECIFSDLVAMQEALEIHAPLESLERSSRQMKDRLEIVQRELADIKELQHLGLYREGTQVKQLASESQRQKQSLEISRLSDEFDRVQKDWKELADRRNGEHQRQQARIRQELTKVTPRVLADLEATLAILDRILQSGEVPQDIHELTRLKDLILKRQLRGLKDIANHALVVEQSAIAPLTMGIIHYKRHREIQEAMTTFIRDEAKHSATFRRFLVEKLEAKEYISAILIRGANRYMWLARFLPATGMFLAVIVEIIGAAYLEFFATEKYMPDKLFRGICSTISTQDEKRHIDLCVAMYNELFRKANAWERIRNKSALKKILQSVYGDKDEDHHLIQAFRAFGVESSELYKYIVGHLSSKLARIGMYIQPEELLHLILGDKAKNVRFEH
jgi:hypothetical protein